LNFSRAEAGAFAVPRNSRLHRVAREPHWTPRGPGSTLDAASSRGGIEISVHASATNRAAKPQCITPGCQPTPGSVPKTASAVTKLSSLGQKATPGRKLPSRRTTGFHYLNKRIEITKPPSCRKHFRLSFFGPGRIFTNSARGRNARTLVNPAPPPSGRLLQPIVSQNCFFLALFKAQKANKCSLSGRGVKMRTDWLVGLTLTNVFDAGRCRRGCDQSGTCGKKSRREEERSNHTVDHDQETAGPRACGRIQSKDGT